MNVYAILADCLVVAHLAYISYVIFGQLAIMIGWPLQLVLVRNPWFRLSHLTMILIVALEAVVRFECPLTTWELELRVQAGQLRPDYRKAIDDDDAELDIEDMSFIARMVRGVLVFDWSWGPILKAGYYTFAGVVVATLFLVPPRLRRQRTTAPVASPDTGICELDGKKLAAPTSALETGICELDDMGKNT